MEIICTDLTKSYYEEFKNEYGLTMTQNNITEILHCERKFVSRLLTKYDLHFVSLGRKKMYRTLDVARMMANETLKG